jgi:phospholipid/cholesterol/gamma-HCH transport system substrate-binding protein
VSRRPGDTGVATNPVLVGALTVLVTVVAVFVSYNANSGLPFVPSYEITVRLPDGNGLQNGRDVRMGGARVGVVSGVRAVVRRGKPFAEAQLKLEDRFGPLRSDSVVSVRPLSPLGLKYLEVQPGRRGRVIADHGTLALSRSKPTIDLATTLGEFDAGTREVGRQDRGGAQAELARRGTGLVGLGTALAGPVAALAGVAPASAELGTGLAGRGTNLNRVVENSPQLLAGVERVSRNLADPRTGLHRFVRGADAVFGELAAARPELGGVLEGGEITFAALAGQSAALEDTISQLPATETAGTRALAAARPLLADATVFLRDARPGLHVLRPASRQLHVALRDGIPVLRATPPLARRLRAALSEVDKLVRDPATTATLRKLRTASLSAIPLLEYTAPAQINCNYLALFARNSASVVSEGDRSGTWLRFLPIQAADEVTARADPAPELHVNTYPHTAAPGQGSECEAGKEPFLPGQRIGSGVPGFQGGSTESTSPSSVIPPEPLK